MIYLLKDVLAGLLIVAAAAAAGSRLILEGRSRPPRRPALLRRIHAWAGWSAAGLLFVLTILGFVLAARSGSTGSAWAVGHGHLALAVGVLLLAKMGFLKAFPAWRHFVPGLGLMAAGGAIVLVLGGLGFGVLGGNPSRVPNRSRAAEAAADPDAEIGREIFAGLCAGCHAAGRDAAAGGLGLEGLFKRTILPVSGRPATEESVRLQLRRPFRSMPAFTGLSEAEISALLAYLRRL